MKLVVDSTKAHSAMMPVRWCISQEKAEKWKERWGDDLGVILTVFTKKEGDTGSRVGYSEQSRYFAPLSALMTYVKFSRSGDHHIIAAIVTGKDEVEKLVLSKYSGGQYKNDLLVDYPDDKTIEKAFRPTADNDFLYYSGKSILLDHTIFDVDIAEEFFAEAPSGRESKWVNLCYSGPPRDECAYNWRRIFAYTLQSPVLLLRGLCKLIIAILYTLCGQRGISWEAVFRPSYTIGNVGAFAQYRDSIFLCRKNGKQLPACFMLLMPMSWVIVFSVVVLVHIIFIGFGVSVGFWYYLLKTIFLMTILVVVCLVVWTIPMIVFLLLACVDKLTIFSGISKKVNQMIDNIAKRVVEAERQNANQKLKDSYEHLSCDLLPDEIGVGTLPKKRRTFELRMTKFKSSHCKPFAK